MKKIFILICLLFLTSCQTIPPEIDSQTDSGNSALSIPLPANCDQKTGTVLMEQRDIYGKTTTQKVNGLCEKELGIPCKENKDCHFPIEYAGQTGTLMRCIDKQCVVVKFPLSDIN